MPTVEARPDLQATIIYLVGQRQSLPLMDFGSPQHGRLAYFASDSIALYIGATYGVTDIISEFLDEAPELLHDKADWETIEEGSITVGSVLELVPHGAAEGRAASAIPIVNVGPGTYMVRASSTGRDPHRNDVKLRIQLWPTRSLSPLRSMKVGDGFDPNSVFSVIPQHHIAPTATTSLLTLPSADSSLLIRTDFSSDQAWDDVVRRVRQPVPDSPGVEFAADVRPVSDTRFDGATVEDLLQVAGVSDDSPFYIFVADAATFTDPEFTILAIDLDDNPGQTVRVPPEHMWAIENNLALGNSDFADFMRAANDGVFRNWT